MLLARLAAYSDEDGDGENQTALYVLRLLGHGVSVTCDDGLAFCRRLQERNVLWWQQSPDSVGQHESERGLSEMLAAVLGSTT